MNESLPLPDKDYKVVIKCFTYNQEAFIEETLKGFVMQQTTFPFCALVVDDCSTDGTADIIRRYESQYPEIIKGFYLQENYHSQRKPKAPLLKPWFDRTEYVALCEGDDYWTSPDKLQKQVDALDSHPEAILCHTGFNCVDEQGQVISRPFYEKCMNRSHSGDNLLTMFGGNYIMTLTVMYRPRLIFSEVYLNAPAKLDFSLAMAAAVQSDVVYIPERMASYRQNPKGAMATENKQVKLATKKAYQYYSRLVLEGKTKKINWLTKWKIVFHIIVRSIKIKEYDFLDNIKRDFSLVKFLYPFAKMYSKTNVR